MKLTFWSISFKIGDQLLLLGEHGLEGVQLGLQLLDRDLAAALWGCRVLGRNPAGNMGTWEHGNVNFSKVENYKGRSETGDMSL